MPNSSPSWPLAMQLFDSCVEGGVRRFLYRSRGKSLRGRAQLATEACGVDINHMTLVRWQRIIDQEKAQP